MSENNNRTNNLINFSEAAKMLSCSRPTIYRMIERGLLHPKQVSDRQYLDRDEIEELNKKTWEKLPKQEAGGVQNLTEPEDGGGSSPPVRGL